MRIKKGKILLEVIYNIFLWIVFYTTTINNIDEQYARSLFLFYIPIIYQEGFIIHNLIEKDYKKKEESKKRKNLKVKNDIVTSIILGTVFWVNVLFVIISALRFFQALAYLTLEKNGVLLYTLGIHKYGFLMKKDTMFLMVLGFLIVISCLNCLEEE